MTTSHLDEVALWEIDEVFVLFGHILVLMLDGLQLLKPILLKFKEDH